MNCHFLRWLPALLLAAGMAGDALAEKAPVHPIAVLPFQERGGDVRELGGKVSDLLFAELAARPELILVDRAEIDKLLKEQDLNLSGLVNPQEAVRAGQLTGAKLLVTGSVLQVDASLYLTAKVIGTETGRVVGDSVKGGPQDDLGSLAAALAEKLAKTIDAQADKLVARPLTKEDRIVALQRKLGDAKRPVLRVQIAERHVGAPAIDPAAETEFTLFATETGFSAVDPRSGRDRTAEVLIMGVGFSEFAARHGNLVSVKARLEVKAVDPASGRILGIERQTAVAVDLTEQLAGKAALQEASAAIAERLLPKVTAGKQDVKELKKGKAK